MAYVFRYRLASAPTGLIDGSAVVSHQMAVVYQSGAVWLEVPGRSLVVYVPADALKVVMDMPDGTGPQKTAKTAAYKSLVTANLTTQPVSMPVRWSQDGMAALLDANAAAVTEATRADTFIRVTLGQTYPVDFAL
jgi:hypothetical protein